MADLAGALDDALSARYRVKEIKTPVSQRRGLLARLSALEKKAARKGDRPGQAANRAAAAAGVSRYAWSRWKSGKQKPTEASLTKIERAYQSEVRVAAFRRKLKGQKAPSRVNVTGIIKWSYSSKKQYNATRYRTVKFTSMGPLMARVIRESVLRGPDAAAEALERGLSDMFRVPDDGDRPGIEIEGYEVEIEFP